MADQVVEPTNISDDNVQDVSLVNPAPAEPAEQTPASEPADKGKEDAAATTPEGEPKGDEKKAEGEETPPEPGEEPAKPEDQPKETEADERARLARAEFQNRQRAKNNIANRVDQNYAPKTADDLVDEGMSKGDAQVEALRQEILYRDQRAFVAELNAGLQSDAVNVEHDMPVFNPKSSDYDEGFTAQVQNAYMTAARLQTDENGLVLNAEVPLYDFYKQMNDIRQSGISKGNENGQQSAMSMMASSEEPGGSSSAGNKGPESLAEMEARLGDVVIT